MNLFRTESSIVVAPAEVLEDGGWKQTQLHSKGGMILTDLTEQDHDLLVNFHQNYDPDCLKGIVITLHVKGQTEEDPEQINVLALPTRGQVLRHHDKYYLVRLVLQSSVGSAAVFAEPVKVSDFWELDVEALLSR